MPTYTLAEVAQRSGEKGVAWVIIKGVVYDVTNNEVYRAKGGYNCFAGKDATEALAKMDFEVVGSRDWRRKLNFEHLLVLDEWAKWYASRYKKVGYLKEDYDFETKNK